MKIASFPGMFALRFPYFRPEDDQGGGEEIDPAFVEQPGDREPEPDTLAAEEPAAEEEAETEEGGGEEHIEQEADSTDDTPAEATAEGEEAEEEPEPQPKKSWKDRQIIKARKAAADAAARAAELEAENARLKAAQEGGEGGEPSGPDPAAVQAAKQELQREERVKRINANCDAMFDAGAKAFPKTWETRVKEAAEVFSDELRARPDFLETVTELPNAAAVYHSLAGDPDRMEDLLEMPPHKMGLELAKLSASLEAKPKPKAISKAPAPIKPLDKPNVGERTLEELANDPSPEALREFDRRMAAEEQKRFAGR